jgi:hypothetical protein
LIYDVNNVLKSHIGDRYLIDIKFTRIVSAIISQ